MTADSLLSTGAIPLELPEISPTNRPDSMVEQEFLPRRYHRRDTVPWRLPWTSPYSLRNIPRKQLPIASRTVKKTNFSSRRICNLCCYRTTSTRERFEAHDKFKAGKVLEQLC